MILTEAWATVQNDHNTARPLNIERHCFANVKCKGIGPRSSEDLSQNFELNKFPDLLTVDSALEYGSAWR